MAATDVIHLFRQLMPGQVRGVSWFAPILLPAKELDALIDAMLVRAKVAAMHVGVITAPEGSFTYEGEQQNSDLEVSLEPGAMPVLPPGRNVEFMDMPDQGGATALLTEGLRSLAVGIGVTYEQLSGDYSKVNYSSSDRRSSNSAASSRPSSITRWFSAFAGRCGSVSSAGRSSAENCRRPPIWRIAPPSMP